MVEVALRRVVSTNEARRDDSALIEAIDRLLTPEVVQRLAKRQQWIDQLAMSLARVSAAVPLTQARPIARALARIRAANPHFADWVDQMCLRPRSDESRAALIVRAASFPNSREYFDGFETREQALDAAMVAARMWDGGSTDVLVTWLLDEPAGESINELVSTIWQPWCVERSLDELSDIIERLVTTPDGDSRRQIITALCRAAMEEGVKRNPAHAAKHRLTSLSRLKQIAGRNPALAMDVILPGIAFAVRPDCFFEMRPWRLIRSGAIAVHEWPLPPVQVKHIFAVLHRSPFHLAGTDDLEGLPFANDPELVNDGFPNTFTYNPEERLGAAAYRLRPINGKAAAVTREEILRRAVAWRPKLVLMP
jgi:hypothetical protein